MAQKKNPNRGRLANDLSRMIFELKYTQNFKYDEIYPQTPFSNQIYQFHFRNGRTKIDVRGRVFKMGTSNLFLAQAYAFKERSYIPRTTDFVNFSK